MLYALDCFKPKNSATNVMPIKPLVSSIAETCSRSMFRLCLNPSIQVCEFSRGRLLLLTTPQKLFLFKWAVSIIILL